MNRQVKDNGKRGKGIQCAEQPRGVVYPLGGQFIQHTNTRTHTAACYQYCSCRGSYHGGVRQLLSPEQEMCGRYGKGKATWLTTLLIKTCQTASVCAPVCSLCALA